MNLRLLAVVAASFLLANCSTIVEGTDQSVTVLTHPAGANCSLERRGAIVGVVNPTPGSVMVDKSKDNIAVTCEKQGYQRTASAIRSEFQGMTFGNILFGGLIGVAIDASSGAMNEYPPSVTLHLPPETFRSPEERDRFYEERKEEVRKEAALARKSAADKCAIAEGEAKDCTAAFKAIDDERDRQLEEIEAERTAAKVAIS